MAVKSYAALFYVAISVCGVTTTNVTEDANPVLYWSGVEQSRSDKYVLRYLEGDPASWLMASDTLIIKGLEGINQRFLSVASNYRDQHIYYYNGFDQTFRYLDNPLSYEIAQRYSPPNPLLTASSDKVTALCFDWAARNLYWSDAAYNWIALLSLRNKATYHTVIVSTGLRTPTDIVVHPRASLLFWSDRETRRVERATLAGQDRKQLVTDQEAVSLAIDDSNDVIYWFDAISRAVHSCAIDCQNPTEFASLNVDWMTMALHGRYLFTMQRSARITVHDTTSRRTIKSLSFPNQAEVYDMEMVSSQNQIQLPAPCDDVGCDQLCVGRSNNTEAQCLCIRGYHLLPDNVSCAVDSGPREAPFYVVLYETSGTFHLCHFDVTDLDLVNEQCFPDLGWSEMVAFSVSPLGRQIVAAFATNITMYTLSNGTLIPNHIFSYKHGGNISALAVDWSSGNVYWTDVEAGAVLVTRMSGKSVKAIQSDLTEPMFLTLDALGRKIYFVTNRRTIRSQSLDGDQSEVVIVADYVIAGMVVDPVFQRLYWAEKERRTIKTIETSGGSPTSFKTDLRDNAAALFVYQDFLIWLSEESNGFNEVTWADQADEQVTHQYHNTSRTLVQLVPVSAYGQPPDTTDGCSVGNGGCQHFCFPKLKLGENKQRVCGCDVGYALTATENCVRGNLLADNFVLVSDGSRGILSLSLYAGDTAIVPVNVTAPARLAYDADNATVYWTSTSQDGAVYQAYVRDQETKPSLIISTAGTIGDIAFDSVSRMIYLTNQNTGEVQRVPDTGGPAIAVVPTVRGRPMSLALDVDNRFMYWTISGDRPGVMMASMEGEGQVTKVIDVDIESPNAIAIDTKAGQLFWCDDVLHVVEMSDIHGHSRRIILRDNQLICSDIAVDVNYVFIIDEIRRSILLIDRKTYQQKSLGGAEFFDFQGIHVVEASGNTGQLTVVLGATLGGGALLIIIAVVTTCTCKKRCRRKKRLERNDVSVEPVTFSNTMVMGGTSISGPAPELPPLRGPTSQDPASPGANSTAYLSLAQANDDRATYYETPAYLDVVQNGGKGNQIDDYESPVDLSRNPQNRTTDYELPVRGSSEFSNQRTEHESPIGMDVGIHNQTTDYERAVVWRDEDHSRDDSDDDDDDPAALPTLEDIDRL